MMRIPREQVGRKIGCRQGLLLALIALSGCGAQDLYAPPEAPFSVVGRLPLPSEAQGVDVLGDYAFVAGGQAGVLTVDLTDPSNPVLLQILDTVKFAEAIRVASTLHMGGVMDVAFVVEGTEGITTYDVTDPDSAYSFEQGTTAVDGNGLFVELPDTPGDPYIVYLAESWKGLRIFESDPTIPGLLHYNGVFSSTRGYARAVTVSDGYAYVADDEMGLAVLDVRTRALGAVKVISSCDTEGYARGVAMNGNYVCVSDYENGLVIMEVREGDTLAVPMPFPVGHLPLNGRCEAIRVRDGMAFIAAQDGGVHVVDVSIPTSPQSLGTIHTSYATGVALSNSGLVVISDRDEGLVVASGAPFIDDVPPSDITDLAATGIDSTTIRLTWHAPGNDGLSGTATHYDIRYALSSIDSMAAWNVATQVLDEPSPAPHGQEETHDVTGLEPGTTYYFVMRTADGARNWSWFSNVASATTPTGNVPPTLRDGRVTPDGGTVDSVYTYEVVYEDADGDPPAVAEVYIDGVGYDMMLVSGDYETGALFRYSSALPVGADYEYYFRFADEEHDPVTSPTAAGPWVGELCFLMGSPTDEPGRDLDETRHKVVITHNIWVSDHEVTQSEYQAAMGTNPSRFVGVGLPVENVTWFDAVAYCNMRSDAEGFNRAYTIDGETVTWNRGADGYRLPTEAEWETACRGGTSTAFAGGGLTEEACGIDPVLINYGWYCGNSDSTHAVGSLTANPWGLYDMHGNVWEWCWDWYVSELGSEIAADPEGPPGGSQRAIRGGSWYYFARHCRSASRAPYWPNSKDNIVGFRVVRTVP